MRTDILEDMGETFKDDMSEDELGGLIACLQRSGFTSYDEKQVDRTIEVLQEYMDNEMGLNMGKKGACMNIKDLMGIVILYSGKWFIPISTLIYILGFYFTVSNSIGTPYGIVMILSPIPFIMGLADVFKSRNIGMEELEMSMKVNHLRVITAKIFFVSVINIYMNVILAIAFMGTDLNVDFWRMTVYWCAPFFTISGISLAIAALVRSGAVIQVMLSLWVILSSFFMYWNKTADWLLKLSTNVYTAVSLVSAVFMVCETYFLFVRSQGRSDILEAYDRKHIKAI